MKKISSQGQIIQPNTSQTALELPENATDTSSPIGQSYVTGKDGSVETKGLPKTKQTIECEHIGNKGVC
jgi:hypothetical protein